MTVRNGDILAVGRHYRLRVCLFNVADSGLFEDNEFEEINFESSSGSNQPVSDFYSPSKNSVNDDKRTVIG